MAHLHRFLASAMSQLQRISEWMRYANISERSIASLFELIMIRGGVWSLTPTASNAKLQQIILLEDWLVILCISPKTEEHAPAEDTKSDRLIFTKHITRYLLTDLLQLLISQGKRPSQSFDQLDKGYEEKSLAVEVSAAGDATIRTSNISRYLVKHWGPVNFFSLFVTVRLLIFYLYH